MCVLELLLLEVSSEQGDQKHNLNMLILSFGCLEIWSGEEEEDGMGDE